MAGVRINFNAPSSVSKVHDPSCSFAKEQTGEHTLWIDDVPIAVAREWVSFHRLPAHVDALVQRHFGHDSSRYANDASACQVCDPI